MDWDTTSESVVGAEYIFATGTVTTKLGESEATEKKPQRSTARQTLSSVFRLRLALAISSPQSMYHYARGQQCPCSAERGAIAATPSSTAISGIVDHGGNPASVAPLF